MGLPTNVPLLVAVPVSSAAVVPVPSSNFSLATKLLVMSANNVPPQARLRKQMRTQRRSGSLEFIGKNQNAPAEECAPCATKGWILAGQPLRSGEDREKSGLTPKRG